MGQPVRTRQMDTDTQHLRESLSRDFSGAYMAVNDQLRRAERRPDTMTPARVAALNELLTDNGRFASARQRFFLLKQTALTLTVVYTAAAAPKAAARLARKGLHQALGGPGGPALRAAAAALGNLPVRIPSPDPPEIPTTGAMKLPLLSCEDLIRRAGVGTVDPPYFMGRTLILPSRHSDELVAVKLARGDEDAPHLAREAFWLAQLAARQEWKGAAASGEADHIPTLMPANGTPLFRLQGIPIAPPATVLDSAAAPDNGIDRANGRRSLTAIAFKTRKGYFTYPNDTRPDRRPPPADLLAIMTKNARQMGALASRGILHTAPIPLFHNRIQRHRRDDGGRYQWFRAGRLDRWLTSCAYPNMGATGLRDFEHLEPHCGSSEKLFREIGSQFLSFLLVAGSYFRSAAPHRVGLDAGGQPVDVRHLFDTGLLEALIQTIFESYYTAFTGRRQSPSLGTDIGRLCHRMAAEMGKDRYMIEVLRAVDQREMKEAAFIRFLREGGMSAEAIARHRKGERDIELVSGPHLGNFNRQISLPELTDAVGVMAALCMDGRYAADQDLSV